MAAALVLAVTGAAVMLSGAAATAAPPPGTLGTLTFTPTTGLDTTIITAHTSAGCSTGGNAADLEVTGPVGAANPTFPPGTVVTTTENNIFSTTDPFTVPAGLQLKDVADILHTTIQPGEYDFTVVCQDQDFLTKFGTFTGAISFTDSTHYITTGSTSTPIPGGPTPTPTPGPIYADIFNPPAPPRLNVTPNSPAAANTTETLTASADTFFSPGTLQFMDNGTSIGSWVPVVAGGASITTTLPPGTHTLTVGFAGHCPTDPHPWIHISCLGGTTSTSNAVTYVVNPPPPSPGPTPPAGVISTTTTLQAAPNPGFTFFPEFLVARVAPANAVGTVQFFDGNTPLGGGPVPVFGGFAFLTAPLPEGTHSLTAMFTPTDPAALTPSTSSPVSLTVQSIFGGLGFWDGNTPPWPLLGRNTPPGALPGGTTTFPPR